MQLSCILSGEKKQIAMKNKQNYNVGMYGGSFDPLHIGHIHDIIKASSLCKELYVIISWCKNRESIEPNQIYRWIHYTTKHLTNIKIKLIEDKAVSKEEYNTDYYWEKGAQDIKNIIGKKIDAVFCGDDYYGKNRFEPLYKESKVIYFKRAEVPISSTEIRFDPYENWEYLPPICKEYYTKKVLIIGSESTGKSTLCKNLALAYNTNYVEEIGRITCDDAGGEEYMNNKDLIINLINQKSEEIKLLKNSNKILFIDTDALTTKFYINFLLNNEDEINKCNKLADAINNINDFDLILFLEPTVEFIQDGTRNEKINKERKKYSEQLKSLYKENNIPIVFIDGDYNDRFVKAKEQIKKQLNIDTLW